MHFSEVRVKKNLALERGQNKVMTKLSSIKLSFFVHPQVFSGTGGVQLQSPVRRSATKSRLLPHLAPSPRSLAVSARPRVELAREE
jgi:hypothetical protein